MGTFRSTAVHFVWPATNVEELLGCIGRALGGEVGDWDDDGGELTGIAGLMSADGLNLATYWKPGFFAPLETLGLSITSIPLEDGSQGLRIFAVIPPGGSPLSKGKQGLVSIASMPGANWAPFEGMGLGALSVDFVSP